MIGGTAFERLRSHFQDRVTAGTSSACRRLQQQASRPAGTTRDQPDLTALLFPGSQARTIENHRVDTRRLRPRATRNSSITTTRRRRPSSEGRRTRGLPAGMNPIRSPSRPRQAVISQEPPETFAINSEGEEKDKTPDSHILVSSPERQTPPHHEQK